MIGSQWTNVESGWVRFDDKDSNITYINMATTSNSSCSGNSHNYTQVVNQPVHVKFNFISDKIRIIGFHATNRTRNAKIIIDGVFAGTISQYSGSNSYCIVSFEALQLEYREHSVEIYAMDNGYFSVDAIDLDINGILRPYNPQAQIIANATNIYENVYSNTPKNLNYKILPPTMKTGYTETSAVTDTNPINLGNGKMFTLPVDLTKWQNITNINLK